MRSDVVVPGSALFYDAVEAYVVGDGAHDGALLEGVLVVGLLAKGRRLVHRR